MKLTTFSIIWCVIYGSFGLGLLIAPKEFMEPYGLSLESNGIFMSRILGSALTAFALLFLLNKRIPHTEQSQHNILLSSLIYNLIDMPFVLMAILNGVLNSLGWIPFGLHIFLASTLGYFAFKKE